jgi:hypothetical protein
LKSLDAEADCFVAFRRDETNLCPTKPFWAFCAELRKRLMVINRATTSAQSATGQAGDSQMPTISFLLAFAFVLAGSSMAGSADAGLPGIGTFSYNGSPIAAPQTVVVAAR